MLSLYRFFFPFLLLSARAAAKALPGVAEALGARSGVMDRWRTATFGANRIWFHVASVGELEQVRPVLERLRREGYFLVLSYFSPSVPRLVKDWSFVGFAEYLPLDRAEDMTELMRIVAPRALVLNRYDLWPNHLLAARDWQVPVVVINASTPPLTALGKLGLIARRAMFKLISAWTFVDSVAAAAWEPYIERGAKGLVAGNPRVDRALQRVENALAEKKAAARIDRWRREDICLVAGSTWEKDEAVILAAWRQVKGKKSLVLVPHEPEAGYLARLENTIKQAGFTSVRFSELTSPSAAEILIVGERGFLAELYGAGNVSYVGGGYNREVHSIIEPLAHGLPVAFGPNFSRSPEAVTLKATGSALTLPAKDGAPILAEWIETMVKDADARGRAGNSLKVFLKIHRGAGERIAEFLMEFLGDKPALPDRALASGSQASILNHERGKHDA